MVPIDDKSNKTLSKMVQLWTTNIHRATAWGGVDSPPKEQEESKEKLICNTKIIIIIIIIINFE